ncbi:Ester hydrolase C11orf54 -like protein [Toxocara canis]|uniref:Ester hydrolase C11orf54-like protein n=1 Tax=Toxocara canis TaxID=6265 RepID=A0A0B2VG58_TOXCA|nr:Ester hydrolase C11orf54 -like protein [Toxocara canis]
MAMQDASDKLDAKIILNAPSLEELRPILENALKKNFEQVSVDIVECPNFKAPPFSMSGAGIGNDLRIGEIGGIGNLYPSPRTDKVFDLKEICVTCEIPEAFIFGPGAGPFHVVGHNCEMVADANFIERQNNVATKIAEITASGKGYRMSTIDKTGFALMANLAISDGRPNGKVLRIRATKRNGEMSYPESIRKALTAHYGETLVSLAGVFVLKKGKVHMHVMPDFPGCPWKTHEQVNEWLKYFEMNAPLVCTSVLHSNDVGGHKLRLEHTHCFSEHGDAGHYHYDTTPNDVDYDGYFAPANVIYRIDMV